MAKTVKTEQEEPLKVKLWKAADKLRKNMDAAEYKHVALGLIFLKYISDAFIEQYEKLVAQKSDGADPEDKNEYVAEKVFFVPITARWPYIQGRATQPTIGKDIDDAMDAIEKDNPSLRGVLPKVFAQEKLDKASLGGLVNLVGSATLGTKEAQSKDLLGQVFEYFLGEFALAEGKKGGQFYTPQSVVKLLVEMLEPYEGRVFDPCCGSGGMFVQSEKFIKSHQDNYKKKASTSSALLKNALNPADRISIYGQESNQTTWRLAKMNLSIRGIDSSNVKWNNEGSFLNDAHKDLKADYIIANSPFNDSDWSGELLRDDARWKVLGSTITPPTGNANYAWIQHFLYHLAPTGQAGFVLSKGALTTNTTGEGDIRKALSFYSAAGGRGEPTLDLTKAIELMNEKFEVVQQFFNEEAKTQNDIIAEEPCAYYANSFKFNYKRFFNVEAKEKLSIILQAEEHILGLQDGKARFTREVTLLSQAFALSIPHEKAMEIKDDIAFFQAVKARLVKFEGTGTGKSDIEIETAIKQIVDEALSSDKVIDIFEAAGIDKPEISGLEVLSDEFLLEVKGMKHQNLALELLKKLLNDEIKTRSKTNLVKSKHLLEMLEGAIKRYQNNLLTTAEIIQELINIAKEIKEADKEGEQLGLTKDEVAFYNALEVNDSAVMVLGDEQLREIAREITEKVKANATIDWTIRESARARLMVIVKRTLTKWGYPPDKQAKAIETVLKQAELMADFFTRD